MRISGREAGITEEMEEYAAACSKADGIGGRLERLQPKDITIEGGHTIEITNPERHPADRHGGGGELECVLCCASHNGTSKSETAVRPGTAILPSARELRALTGLRLTEALRHGDGWDVERSEGHTGCLRIVDRA